MDDEQASLNEDLASALRSAVDGDSPETSAQRLSALEAEHRALSDRRSRLHESIDIMAAAKTVRPDATALLERYRISERKISWRRQVLYREIGALRSRQVPHGSKPEGGADTQAP